MRRHVPHAHKVRPAGSERKQWLVAIDAARTIARRVLGTSFAPSATATLGEQVNDFAVLLKHLRPSGFPLQDLSATAIAESFCGLGRAMTLTTLETRRLALASVLDAAATALFDMIEDLRAEEASRSWGRYSGDMS